mmetsp:Transcript_102461/g.260196  ORF Transcript_102461/g.260196 Transcript_102461/m.260196 type:complete len:405 (-) Transcript_102461:157-1371(-)
MAEAATEAGHKRPLEADVEEGHPAEPSARREEEEDPESRERDHFYDVCWSCFGYRDDALKEVARFQALCNSLSPEDLAIWGVDVPQTDSAMQMGIEMNSRFLQILPTAEVCGAYMSQRQEQAVFSVPMGHRIAGRNMSKVRTTLRQFVRDWAAEGQAERDATYTPLIQALERHLPAPALGSGARKPRVLCPGSGLGRLPFDLARLGYAAQGNEFSYHMLLGSHLIYNRTQQTNCYMIFPFLLSSVNRKGRADNLKSIRVPDVCPCLSLTADCDVSMAAGEFVSVYKDQKEEWDGIATAFFIDTAKNIFLYIRTIAEIVRPGGVWTNLGPLLYHYSDVENEISIELSWEEVRPAICKYFNIVEEERRNASYTMNSGSMMRTVFRCIFFTAVRNSEPITGKSNPVY